MGVPHPREARAALAEIERATVRLGDWRLRSEIAPALRRANARLLAVELLAAGTALADVVTALRARFGLCRTVAYDVAASARDG